MAGTLLRSEGPLLRRLVTPAATSVQRSLSSAKVVFDVPGECIRPDQA